MRKTIALPVLLLAICAAPCSAFENGDFQYWNTNAVSYKPHKDWEVGIDEELRFGDSAGRLYYEHTEGGITYAGLARWLSVGAHYRLISEEKKKNKWEYENMPNANATLRSAFAGFTVSDRNRIEYRDKEKGTDGWRYRNKCTVAYPLALNGFLCSPYVADEVFVDFREEKCNKNRLFGGVECNVLKNLRFEVYYMWQVSEKDRLWTSCHVLGTKVRLRL